LLKVAQIFIQPRFVYVSKLEIVAFAETFFYAGSCETRLAGYLRFANALFGISILSDSGND
jgi:hypothetical protein